jgi:hypothetical protein
MVPIQSSKNFKRICDRPPSYSKTRKMAAFKDAS